MHNNKSINRLLVNLASLVLVVAGLRAIAQFLGPILLSLFIVLFSGPLLTWLRRRRIPASLAYFIVILAVVAIGIVLITFLTVSVGQLSAALPNYKTLLTQQLQALETELQSKGFEATDLFKLEIFKPTKLLSYVVVFISGLLNTVGNVGLTLFIFMYMLVGSASFSRKLRSSLGYNQSLLQRIEEFGGSVSTYLFIKTWLGALTAFFQTILLLIIGVDFAILWGVLSFLFNYIPNIGYIIALLPPLVLALLKFGLVKAIIVFIGYAVINNFFDMVIGPRYLGRGLDLSTLVTFLAVIFWTWILGPVGAFLALPLTVMLKKLFLETYEDTRWLAKLMGSEENESRQADKD